MFAIFINEEVDIYQIPPVDNRYVIPRETQVTMGDLHGNAMKLLFMLVKQGIANNIGEYDYKRFVAIYRTKTNNLTREILSEFNELLNKIVFKNDLSIRLIGGDLADCGNNDYFTLKILEKLSQHKISVEILLSNHGIEFIEAYEKQNNFNPTILVSNSLSNSMKNLQTLIDKGIVLKEELLKIIDNAYKPSLRAISYSLSKNNKEITIYSHAGIGLNIIKCLSQKLEVEYKEERAGDLARTIDSINNRFQEYVRTETVNKLYSRDILYQSYRGPQGRGANLGHSPLEFILWNETSSCLRRPLAQFGYTLNFVHGHNSDERTEGNIYNLHSYLGESKEGNRGVLTLFYSYKDKMPCLGKLPTIFFYHLDEIKKKIQDLRRRNHNKAASHATILYYDLMKNFHDLASESIPYPKFEENCMKAIKAARPELKEHRGWKQLIGNIALAILGVGILYLAAGVINKIITGHFLFFRTDSINKINRLQQTIEPMAGF